jgi:hypothetical protein
LGQTGADGNVIIEEIRMVYVPAGSESEPFLQYGAFAFPLADSAFLLVGAMLNHGFEFPLDSLLSDEGPLLALNRHVAAREQDQAKSG